jgi:hypothetical protein
MFYKILASQKSLVTKVVDLCNDAHLYQKYDQDSKVCCETYINHGQTGRKPSELLLRTHSLNLNLNGFNSKIIQYMAPSRDNS